LLAKGTNVVDDSFVDDSMLVDNESNVSSDVYTFNSVS